MEKIPKKVKVYGLDSTKAIRARLIELLIERSMYHKDKFISPLLWDEMRCMEVKKSGKVEHSDKTHDDTVFSYLMALYVWYDGKNLVENFNIRKNVLKTDTDEILDEDTFEDEIEARESVDIKSSTFELDPEINKTLEWVENHSGIITSEDIRASQYLTRIEMKDKILSSNKSLQEEEILETGVNTSINQQYNAAGFIDLDDNIFDLDDDINSNQNSYLAGNLSDIFIKL